MISCRYVGSGCALIGDREFDAVGQIAVLSERGFAEAVLGNAHFITEEDFTSCGFTAEELEIDGPYGSRVNPSPTFGEKLAKAQLIFRDTHARLTLNEGQVLAEASDVDVREPEPAVDL